MSARPVWYKAAMDIEPGFTVAELLGATGPRFPFRMTVRFQDVDAAGIVFFARIYDFVHDAYVAFLAARGAPLDEALRTRAWVAPIRRADGEFLRPMRFGDAIEVALVRARLAGSDLRLGWVITGADGKPAAVVRTHHVYVDPHTWKRTDAPAIVRAAFSELQAA